MNKQQPTRSATGGRGAASAPRSIRVPGHSRQRTKLLPCFFDPGGLKAAPPRARRSPPGVASLSSGAPSASSHRRQEPAVAVAVILHRPSSPRPRARSSADRSGTTSTAAYRTPRTGRRRPLPVEQPAMSSAPKWTRRNRHLRLSGMGRPGVASWLFRRAWSNLPPRPYRGSSALASRSLSA